MPRSRSLAPPAAGPLCTLDPHTVYDLAGLLAALCLKRSTIRREVKAGRLRASRRAGRCYFLGSWLREWLEGGEPVAIAAPEERRARAGLDSGSEGMTLETIGEKLGITKERVRQLNVRAMKKMRTLADRNKDALP